MVFIKNPLIPKRNESHVKFQNPEKQSAGILDDFAVRKSVQSQEGYFKKLDVYNPTENAGMSFGTGKTDGQAIISLTNDVQYWTIRNNGADSDSFQITSLGVSKFVIDTAGNVDIINGTLDMNSHKIENTLDPTNDQEVATKKYVDDAIAAGGGSVTLTRTAFDITANTEIVAAAGAGIKICVAAISMHNNDTTSTNDTHVKITDGNAGTVLIGGATGNIYLVGRGGFFGLPMSTSYPWCKTTANTALYINPTDGKRVAGAVWTFEE